MDVLPDILPPGVQHHGDAELAAEPSGVADLIGVLGNGVPPERYDFGGLSGGPMLAIMEHRGLRSWVLAGVIYQGPNPSTDPTEAIDGMEIIKARRAHFILPDGTLDIERWNSLSL